jgi:NhaP-type Na+/H+ or K+/H+ antiporter
MFAIRHGVVGALARQLLTLTLITVSISILVHGISIRPLMKWYARQPVAPE